MVGLPVLRKNFKKLKVDVDAEVLAVQLVDFLGSKYLRRKEGDIYFVSEGLIVPLYKNRVADFFVDEERDLQVVGRVYAQHTNAETLMKILGFFGEKGIAIGRYDSD